jgi:hypothetical protein
MSTSQNWQMEMANENGNYIWKSDQHKKKNKPNSRQQHINTLVCLVTLGAGSRRDVECKSAH